VASLIVSIQKITRREGAEYFEERVFHQVIFLTLGSLCLCGEMTLAALVAALPRWVSETGIGFFTAAGADGMEVVVGPVGAGFFRRLMNFQIASCE
jgi:hypothetical protein